MCDIEIEGRAIRALRLAPGAAGSSSTSCARGRAAPPTTSSSRGVTIRYWSRACRSSARAWPRACDASPGWSTSSTTASVKLIIAAEVPARAAYAGVPGRSRHGAHAQPADRDADRAVSEHAAPGVEDRSRRQRSQHNRQEDTMTKFKAYRIFNEDGKVEARLVEMTLDELDPGEVVIKTAFSSVNFKDALAATGAGKIIRRFPCVGGIDALRHRDRRPAIRASRRATRSSAPATTWAWRTTAATPSTCACRPIGRCRCRRG